MNAITITQVVEMKEELTAAIQDQINTFLKETGVVVEDIHLTHIQDATTGQILGIAVAIEAKL